MEELGLFVSESPPRGKRDSKMPWDADFWSCQAREIVYRLFCFGSCEYYGL